MKKNMIRAICLILALVMALGLVSCGNTASNSTSNSASGATSGTQGEEQAFDFSKGLDANGHWDGIKALDIVTLPQYKDMEIPADKIAVSDEEINQIKSNLVKPYGVADKIMDTEIKQGDTVNIDYVGSVDGVEFVGGNTEGKGYNLEIGSGSFIEGFEDQLVGHRSGDTFEVHATFPEGYKDSTDKDGNTVVLAGKEAVFVTTVNHIVGEMQYPEFNDEFVTTNLKDQYEWSTAAEAEDGIREILSTDKKYSYIMEKLNEGMEIKEIPESVMNAKMELEVMNAKANAAQYGMPFEQFLTLMGYETEDAFREGSKENVEKGCRQSLMAQAIAETENLEVTEEDINKAFGENASKVLEQYGEGYVKMALLNDKVTELLMDKN